MDAWGPKDIGEGIETGVLEGSKNCVDRYQYEVTEVKRTNRVIGRLEGELGIRDTSTSTDKPYLAFVHLIGFGHVGGEGHDCVSRSGQKRERPCLRVE